MDTVEKSVFTDREGDDQVETQFREVGEVVAPEGFAAEVSTDESNSAETTRTDAVAADVGQVDASGVAEHDGEDMALAVHQNADHVVGLAGEPGELVGELLGEGAGGPESTRVEALEGFALGCLETSILAVNGLRNGGLLGKRADDARESGGRPGGG